MNRTWYKFWLGLVFGESLNLAAKIDLVHAAYKGAAPLVQDLIGGPVQAAWLDAATLAPCSKRERSKCWP